jgi:SAM-dependent methyltransferase
MDERKRIVQAGYDALGPEFAVWAETIVDDPRQRFLEAFAAHLPKGANVLDLGCGAGIPSTVMLAERFQVVGVDLSSEQLRLARKNVPRATFVEADLTSFDPLPGSFSGISAFYSITHVPREEHAELFSRIGNWLEPGGLLVASLGAEGSDDWTGEWLGVEMFFSSFDAEANRRLLREAGFALLQDEVVSIQEPEGSATFLWVLAQKR